MTTREWALVTAVVGLGVLAQIPGHMESGEDHNHPAVDAEALATMEADGSAGAVTVSLHVTGMT